MNTYEFWKSDEYNFGRESRRDGFGWDGIVGWDGWCMGLRGVGLAVVVVVAVGGCGGVSRGGEGLVSAGFL